MKPIKRILVPTDFSACAKEALTEAIGVAQQFGASLTLLHVYQLPSYAFTELSPLYTPEAVKAVEDAAQAGLDELEADSERQLHQPVATKLAMGVPSAEIVGAARDGGFDLIVLGTHGRTGLKHLLVGSVAE
jgi:nucleotide-binding universal stress UspA family protein